MWPLWKELGPPCGGRGAPANRTAGLAFADSVLDGSGTGRAGSESLAALAAASRRGRGCQAVISQLCQAWGSWRFWGAGGTGHHVEWQNWKGPQPPPNFTERTLVSSLSQSLTDVWCPDNFIENRFLWLSRPRWQSRPEMEAPNLSGPSPTVLDTAQTTSGVRTPLGAPGLKRDGDNLRRVGRRVTNQ